MKWLIEVFIFLPLLCSGQPTKDIVTEGKVGDDIVKRVLDVLTSYNVSFDRKCLQDLAFLRSNNGVPYISGKGGIWRVNSSQLTDAQTACQTSLFNQCRISKLLTGEEVSSFDIADLDKPLYSALAMIFYVLSLDKSIPNQDYEKYCKLPIKPLKLSNQELRDETTESVKNPCTTENIEAGRFYFAHPDPRKYIQCTEWGTFFVMLCAPGTIWSQSVTVCVRENSNPLTNDNAETTKDSETSTSCTILKNNPCTKENTDLGKFYFAHPDPQKFIQCTEWGSYYEMPCPLGTVWSQIAYTCIRKSGNKINEDSTTVTSQGTQTILPTVLNNNPCTKENIGVGKFYFSHPDPTKFIQCTEWGSYYEMPCAPGTVWSPIAYTCIHNFVKCNSRKETTPEPNRSTLPFSSTLKWVTRGELS
ncbi:uncharacterized protein LOC106869473 [Octopus bimaculoides]|uniref:Chitin-binding type-2 domain-containing protein n=1 Tax=Octopus bimaculoides TaxID=37653 RepID=A0A0L8HP48_OCTBM|nr:uncharacterized protein LOC106869473 [Octopus bimaculoides]|eukprot:XP_014770711.1 PREDICTED: uncharacterized protein LOC106869473 [Octopus bimaculoides]